LFDAYGAKYIDGNTDMSGGNSVSIHQRKLPCDNNIENFTKNVNHETYKGCVKNILGDTKEENGT
jgi:serine protease inhibitor